MKKLLARFAIVLVVCGMVGLASAGPTTITFTEEVVPDQTLLPGTSYFSSFGISFGDFTTFTFNPQFVEDGAGIYNGIGSDLVTVLWDKPISSVTFSWAIYSSDIYADAYDASNNLVDSFSLVGAPPNGQATLSGSGITRVSWHDGEGLAGIDSMTWIPAPVEVPVDIKPGSCPNPLNVESKGVLPVAIVGTEDFDVTAVDPASVRLAGVAPLRWSLEDIVTPFEPFLGKESEFDCTEEGPDGYLDLTLKFEAQEIVASLGDVEDGDVLALQLVGNLKEEYDGTPIKGEDVVIILEKGQ